VLSKDDRRFSYGAIEATGDWKTQRRSTHLRAQKMWSR